ncbi:hypothetical protein EDD11_006134 [Mortierella claussenii]|nr:hypothetical protein EDD11_006134 [Mortierella claussenii]
MTMSTTEPWLGRVPLCAKNIASNRKLPTSLGMGPKRKAKECGREMDRYNNLARDIVFKANNSSRPANELDLHGLKVREALDICRERMQKFVSNKELSLIIIVGRGNNSINGIAKIKPAVIELMNEFHVKATPNRPNEGCIFVEPLSGGESVDFSWINGFFSGTFRRIFRAIFG